MKKVKKPSAAETAILNVLWEKEPCSVKTIHETLSATKSVGQIKKFIASLDKK